MSSVKRRVLPRVRRTEAEFVDGVRDVDLVSGERRQVVRVSHGPVPGFAMFFLYRKKRKKKKKERGK